ncbi:protein phosphatase CheZ [Iodobacter ciconiae]|uniref:Protein phosphatase CheZ n=1 Tax=Iodobacter ciconiae TaxID=2496266 RepID=A0A3S8ZQ47_9NEIS|nr:protein phosphatase CheZ [Iodobacter ciconiae]AZN35596.1 protein phosphatase CheZ [Iodobacter ciconiae]
MNDHALNSGDSADLEALFDSIAHSSQDSEPTEPVLAAAAPVATSAAPALTAEELNDPARAMFAHIGHLTRKLHDTLKELGLDKSLEKAANDIPDARDRLSYIATLTEQAADRTLNALDAAKPIQDKISDDAKALGGQWDKLLANQLSVDEFKALVEKTRTHLNETVVGSDQIGSKMLEIMMAQDFQDLTGQVIKKVLDMSKQMEAHLMDFLLMFSPQGSVKIEGLRPDEESSLLNGPVINPEGRTDIVTNQGQVDDLLESLGF